MEISYSRNDKIVKRKFYQYLLPTVLMVVAMQIGSMADAIVIGNFVGEAALSASSLALPIIYLLEVPAFGLATGGSIVAANMIAKRDVQGASKVFKITILLAFLISLLFIPFGIWGSDWVASLLVGNFPQLQTLVSQYLMVYFFQIPLVSVGLVLAFFLPSDNHPNLGAAFFIVANVFHIGSEILFTTLGPDSFKMIGAAMSMGIGMVAGCLVFIPYFKSKNRTVDLTTKLKGALAYTKPIFRSGSAMMLTTFLFFVVSLVINLAATQYLTLESEMALLAMLSNFAFVIDLFITGILQIIPSVVSALYGEKDYFGIRVIVRKVLILSIGVAVALTILSVAVPQLFFLIFGVNLSSMETDFASLRLIPPLTMVRIFVLAFLFYTLNKFVLTYYPSIFINSPSLVSTAAKNALLGPVLDYVMIMTMGIFGYALANVIIEAGALGLTIVFILIGKRVGRLKGSGLLLLPDSKKGDEYLDISIPGERSEISKATQELQAYAGSICHDEKAAAMLAVASEEIIANVIQYGYSKAKRTNYIDINVTRLDDHLIVRIRDDGVAFDPTSYQANEEFDYSGIEVIRKIASHFEYLRILNTNNTIIEIAIGA